MAEAVGSARVGLTRRGALRSAAAAGLAASPLVAARPNSAAAAAGGRTVLGLYAADPVAGLALRGFDAVSYFLPGMREPEGGRAGIELRHAGMDWRFSRVANRAAFERAPEVYVPRVGGFDPQGVARGRFVEADPLVYAILDGRLYLFRNPQSRAAVDAAVFAQAEARWPALLASPE